MVAGVAAMAISHRKKLLVDFGTMSTSQVREVIWHATDDYGSAGFDPYSGRGKTNLQKAMLSVGRGDANNDGIVNVSDAVYIINYVFGGGAAPQPDALVGDANCTGTVNVTDASYIIAFVFSGGPAPLICY
jgi:hypothetical protein